MLSNGTLVDGENTVYIRSDSPLLVPTNLVINREGIYALGAPNVRAGHKNLYRFVWQNIHFCFCYGPKLHLIHRGVHDVYTFN